MNISREHGREIAQHSKEWTGKTGRPGIDTALAVGTAMGLSSGIGF